MNVKDARLTITVVAMWLLTVPVAAHAQDATNPTPSATPSLAQHRGYKVFVGSAFFLAQMADRSAWPYTAAHVDGFYNHPVGWRSLSDSQKHQILANVAHKTSIVEGDLSGPMAGTMLERDILVGEMAADNMPVQALFENRVKPNKPQDEVAAPVLAADAEEWTQFCRDTFEKTGASTFFMTAAFQIDGDMLGRPLSWASPTWDYMRSYILAPHCGGSGLDSPVDNYLRGPPARRQAVWDMTHWTQQQGKKFIFLTSAGNPTGNNNAAAFIQHLRQTVASLEDNDAEPDIYAVESYIPTGPVTVPDCNPDGSAANTITGGAYYLLKHRDAEPGTLHLSVKSDDSADRAGATGTANPQTYHLVLTLTNTSTWLDCAPVLKADSMIDKESWAATFAVGGADITPSVFGSGYVFYRTRRLNPGIAQQVDLTLTRKSLTQQAAPLYLVVQVLPHSGSPAIATAIVRER